ncbi:MAG: L-aspartate oxidase [Desulfovibrionaceae bacterium]|nr:L-aspartate oxidase [Desulfovibrionaceae bacterium]
MQSTRRYVPYLIIGSGIAGATAALTLADAGLDVLLLNAGEILQDGNSALAQGGIIYQAGTARGGEQRADAQSLEDDILVAGHNYNYKKAVHWIAHKGPEYVEKILIDRVHIPFDKNPDGSFDLTREGGHSHPRILHKADYTGKAIMDGLSRAIANHPRITCLHSMAAIDLLTTQHHAKNSQFRYEVGNRCVGAYVLNRTTNEPETILADQTILATGGVGRVFLHSTNSESCVGTGIAMAWRAGVELSNLEFMQFHPTALYDERQSTRQLITESLRGEGARLLNAQGEPFMHRYDERGDLAPRDIVAQSMMEEMLSSNSPYLFLDASRVQQDLPTRFPTVFSACQKIGLDIRTDPIPVVPCAHYFCGGILTDQFGRTSLKGLYAIGECACTGLHGANRLASTSLLEGLSFGASCAEHLVAIQGQEGGLPAELRNAIPDWQHEGNEHADDPALVAQDWANIRNTMWNYVGMSRTQARLHRAFEDMRVLVRHIHDFYKRTHISYRLIQLFHGSKTAYAITQAAMRNPQSIGCHHRI